MTEYLQLNNIVGHITDAVFIVDHQGAVIQYANSSALNIIGFDINQIIGKSLNAFSAPHSFNINDNIIEKIDNAINQDNQLFEWCIKSNSSGFIWLQMSANKIIVNGHELIIVIARDINQLKQKFAQLQQINEFNELINIASSNLITIPCNYVNDQIDITLEMLGRRLDVSRAFVMLYSPDRKFINNTHEWCAPGSPSFKSSFQNMPVTQYSWFHQTIVDGIPVCIDDMAIVQKPEQQMFAKRGVKSMLLEPIVFNNQILGVIGLTTVLKNVNWGKNGVYMVKTVANVIAQALERVRVDLELNKKPINTVINKQNEVEYCKMLLNTLVKTFDEFVAYKNIISNADNAKKDFILNSIIDKSNDILQNIKKHNIK